MTATLGAVAEAPADAHRRERAFVLATTVRVAGERLKISWSSLSIREQAVRRKGAGPEGLARDIRQEPVMTQYMISIYEREADYATMSPEGWQSVLDAHGAFSKAVADLGGTITGGGVLHLTTTATSIRGGEVTDGPFVESKEAFGGFYLVEARDLDHALEIAKLTPAPFGGVEIRPVLDASTASGR